MVQGKFRIFVSSVQDEFEEERRRLKEWLSADLFLSRFVENVFLFEDVPSRGNPPQDVYLGTGIGRMIDACRKAGLPDPTWEQRGSSFVVTIWKDMWTEARLREVGTTNRQLLAIPFIKTNHSISVSDYMEITGVKRNTATADLVAMTKSGVLKRTGAGRGSTYLLQKCTINAQNAQQVVNEEWKRNYLSQKSGNCKSGNQIGEGLTGRDPINEGTNEGLNEGLKFDVFRLILENPGCRVPFFVKKLSVSRATVERAVAELISLGKIEHRGSKKMGGYYVKETK